jgi:arginase
MSINKLKQGAVGLIGIRSDTNSSYLRGAAEGPVAIRRALHCGSSNLCSELGVDLGGHPLFIDLGDREIGESSEEFLAIESHISDITARGALPLVLGGDHAITYPVLRAIYAVHGPVNVLHLDAHPDLYGDYEGNPFSHASPFARLLEQGLIGRLVQVGIRTLNAHLRQQVERFGVEVHEMKGLDLGSVTHGLEGPVYISIDLDVLDPAFAPGVSHHEPGGMSVREVLALIQGVTGPVIGADIVELNPSRDINDMTAMVAAKLVKEIAGKML